MTEIVCDDVVSDMDTLAASTDGQLTNFWSGQTKRFCYCTTYRMMGRASTLEYYEGCNADFADVFALVATGQYKTPMYSTPEN